VLDAWAYERRVQLHFIRPGKPVENALVESFNGKFRDDCLNENWFQGLADAREKIGTWRLDYNTGRPRSATGPQTSTLRPSEQDYRRANSGVRSALRAPAILTPVASGGLMSQRRPRAVGAHNEERASTV
jgi:transposase InsO family protein